MDFVFEHHYTTTLQSGCPSTDSIHKPTCNAHMRASRLPANIDESDEPAPSFISAVFHQHMHFPSILSLCRSHTMTAQYQ